ncbi:MAG: DNA replication and repair protein RecF [Actinobacteria bacterium]|nr:MAG: DNA replication and repair protein RecF [Actinomycetota bacterium]
MHLTRIRLRDFRNYERVEVELGPGLNVVAGANGAGKTNLLEGIYFGLTARSCRTSNEREMLRLGAEVARVELEVAAEDGMHTLEVGLEPGQDKRIRVDGALAARGVDPPRPLVSVFLPDRLDLVKGAPAGRRAHLDRLVAALWPARGSTRAAYARALSQRNALIGRVRGGLAGEGLLDQWDTELARHGAELMADRAAAVELISPAFTARAGGLGLPEPGELRYAPRCKADDAEGIRDELAARRSGDIERGFTTHGPHRDDVALLHGGRLLRTLGSQGQQRVALLALLFAERDVLAARGTPPLMLLDDVMSELDSARRERLAALVGSEGQSVVTTTDTSHVPGADSADAAVIVVAAGTTVQHPPPADRKAPRRAAQSEARA